MSYSGFVDEEFYLFFSRKYYAGNIAGGCFQKLKSFILRSGQSLRIIDIFTIFVTR